MTTFTVLELSTAHVDEQTARDLDIGNTGWIVDPRGDYGWWVWVGNGPTTNSLDRCLAYARARGISWIQFDLDVEPIAELPTYDW